MGYLWGTTAIGYDARALAAAVPDAPLDSWALVFDPRFMSKAERCGVSVANYRIETVGNALIFVEKTSCYIRMRRFVRGSRRFIRVILIKPELKHSYGPVLSFNRPNEDRNKCVQFFRTI